VSADYCSDIDSDRRRRSSLLRSLRGECVRVERDIYCREIPRQVRERRDETVAVFFALSIVESEVRERPDNDFVV